MEWLLYALSGVIAGLLAGLLGVGGGLIIVPLLSFIFSLQHMPPNLIQHMALGTSLATIVFTSISSFRAHHKHGAVHWNIFKAITPGILIGTFVGTWVVARLPSSFLKGFFVCFLYYVAAQMLLNFKPKPSRSLPGPGGMLGVGGGIGFISSMVGIGGGTMSVPFMAWCNVPLHHAVGTSAAIGFPIAVAGAIGNMINTPSGLDLPPLALGFVYLPALVGIAAFSMLTAPLGAKLAHSLPVPRLKKIFGFFLILIATKMLMSLF